MGNCECGIYPHPCHGDKTYGILCGADIPVKYKETEVYYEKVPLEPDFWPRDQKSGAGGYTVQDESQVRVETPEEYYEDVPVTRSNSRTTSGMYRTEREVTTTRYQPNYVPCKCQMCRCGKCSLRRSYLSLFP